MPQAASAQRTTARATAPRATTRRRRTRTTTANTAQYDFYFPREIDNSRLVKVADPGERRAFHRMVLVSLMLAAMILGAAYQRFATVRAGYRIEELKLQKEQLMEANRQLRLEEASLRDPERIDTIARNELGLIPAAPGQVVALDTTPAESDGTVIARVQTGPAHVVR